MLRPHLGLDHPAHAVLGKDGLHGLYTCGSLVVDVDHDALRVRFLDADGHIGDDFSISKY